MKKMLKDVYFLSCDDYRSGPVVRLCSKEEYEKKKESPSVEYIHLKLEFGKEYTVYYFDGVPQGTPVSAAEPGIDKSKLMKVFSSFKEAYYYIYSQFQLANGCTPFFSDGGMTGAYHPTGSRGDSIKETSMSKDDDKDASANDDDDDEKADYSSWDENPMFIVTKPDGTVRFYIMNFTSVWTKETFN